MANRKILVTGGAGFIGSHVADAYVARGDKVWVLDNLSTGRESNIPKAAEFVYASVNDDSVGDLFDKVGGFDVVNHHAAQIDVRKSVADPRFDARVNIDGVLNLLQNSLRCGVDRFLFVSSGGVVYGEPDERPTPETAPKSPRSPYGVSKFTSELYLNYYCAIHGLSYAAVRYSNVFGPRQDPHGEAGVVAIFSTKLIDNQPLTIFGDGLQTRDYVFVGDVVSANMLLSDADIGNSTNLDQRAYNVGTGIETSVLDLARIMSGIAGHSGNIKHADERPGEVRHSCLDARKLRGLGWAPAQSIEEGLRITYEFIKNGERGW